MSQVNALLAPVVIDSHVHLWDREILTYPWLDGLGIDGPYHIGDLPSRVADARLEGFVFVQAECSRPESFTEVQWVLDQAATDPSGMLRGIVAQVDLTSPTAATQIENIARIDAVVGVRHNIQGRPQGFAQTLRDGINELAVHGLSFDICCRVSEFPDVLDLVGSCGPTARFVLDHLGKPTVGDGTSYDAWAGQLRDLADASNVVCKLSGLQTELAADTPGHLDVFAPYISHAISVFGIDRVMYGSDWPVCTLKGSMSAWAGVVAAVLGDDEAAHSKVFCNNARRLYRLDRVPVHPLTNEAGRT
ncbi:MAG: amidohydrolase family protein [bacterium]|nr:amidohydrolase family protein [bacterium]